MKHYSGCSYNQVKTHHDEYENMTLEQAIKEFGELEDFEKINKKDKMTWSSPVDFRGPRLFSFDNGKHVYNVFGGGKIELTDEQLATFRKENATMYKLYLANKE